MPTPIDALKEIFTPTPGESPGLFQASTTIVTISAIYLYFAGYVYCYFYYYRSFQVPLETLEASPQFYMIRAFTALNNGFGFALVGLVFLTVMGYISRRVPTWLTAIVMVGAFPALFQISSSAAVKNAWDSVSNSGHRIRIHFKESAGKSSATPEKSATPPRANAGNPTSPPANQAPPPDQTGKSPGKPDDDTLDCDQTDQILPEVRLRERFGVGPDITDPRELVSLGEKNQLFLLIETKDRIVLVRKPQCQWSAVHVYTLPRADLDLTNLILWR